MNADSNGRKKELAEFCNAFSVPFEYPSVSPGRFYTDTFIHENRQYIKGSVLEVGHPRYSLMFKENIENRDVLHAVPNENNAATIIGDLATGENIPVEKYDCFILTHVLTSIFKIEDALRHAYGAIKPGGVLLIVCTTLAQVSLYDMERWGDYWRVTDKCLESLILAACPDAGYTVSSYGNLAVGLGQILQIGAEFFPENAFAPHHPAYPLIVTAVVKKPEAAHD